MQRWMLQKHNRIKVLRERAQGVNKPFAKTEREASVQVAMPDNTPSDLDAVIAAYTGKIRVIPCQGVMPKSAYGVTGKGGRQAFKRTYGDYNRRVRMGALIGL